MGSRPNMAAPLALDVNIDRRRRPRSRSPEASIDCCCGRPDCPFLKKNCSVLESVEKDVHTAAQLGQVRSISHSRSSLHSLHSCSPLAAKWPAGFLSCCLRWRVSPTLRCSFTICVPVGGAQPFMLMMASRPRTWHVASRGKKEQDHLLFLPSSSPSIPPYALSRRQAASISR